MRDLHPSPSCIQVAVSRATDAEDAVREASTQIDRRLTCFVLAFIPGSLDHPDIAEMLDVALGGMPVFGCSTAGQITSLGYESDALLLLGFPRAHFRCASVLFESLAPLSTTGIARKAQSQAIKFPHTPGWSRLGLVLTDGLTKQEDLLISSLETVLDDLPLFGGSAGDSLKFEETYILHRGRRLTNAAVLLLLETNLPFRGVGFDHFLPSDVQVIITDADPDERRVFEINGTSAAQEYARLVGCRVEDLSPQIFAENPLLVQYHDNHYVRAILGADDSGCLTFAAAIDDGLVMTLGRGQEIVETLRAGVSITDGSGHAPDFILGFDCILRKLEIEQKQLGQTVSEILSSARVFGFNTYGEQHCGVHMNQTFVGVAFFKPENRDLY
jgi:hypothetical protein